MRLLLTVIIWIVIIGGLRLYTDYRETVRTVRADTAPEHSVQIQEIHESYSLIITPTFSVEKDPFALDEGDSPASGLTIRINGNELTLNTADVQRGSRLTLTDINHLVQGYNEIFIRATPPLEEAMLDQGIRVQVNSENAPLLDQTLWASSGSPVSGTLVFKLSGKEASHDH